MTERPKVRLIGDHSSYHCGSWAVIDFMRARLSARYDFTSGDDYDVLVANGEGSMHHRSSAYKSKIDLLRAAAERGKPFHLLNTVWQENGAQDADLLRQAASINVREIISRDALLAETGIDAPICPDFSYYADIDPEVPHVDYGGEVVVTDFYSTEFGSFVRPMGGPFSKLPFMDMKALGWSEMVNALKTASLLVTGRHHAVFAACRARATFVALTGNTHKIEGLISSAGVNIPVCKHPGDLKDGMRWARRNRDAYERLFDWMDKQPLPEILQPV
ncbi:polysaccharide pyruvyl transferase family protein [Methylobrevis albus]|uniref:Polysaccharide pyruvyl transferase family protein n=1 Tax=Methylobrevis albus TaxID=2793297 RepID=A0A931HZK6_9HYPH|nr:polysaccharide pyruvyl transferase family protein [Methylobrevis albus]MBH0237647.1 polysaccharide pyruvyl transferase family protein [Methylobrevis albus]